jgi:hypothetical protein
MVNFYRRLLPSIDCTLRPLTDELGGGMKGQDNLEWLAPMDADFAGAKQALRSATDMAHPTVGSEPWVVVDASASHVGACLQQQLPGKKDWQPLGFFSKKLKAAQQKYAASDRELSPATLASAPHLCPGADVRSMDGTPVQAAVLCGRVHVRHSTHHQGSQRGGGHSPGCTVMQRRGGLPRGRPV